MAIQLDILNEEIERGRKGENNGVSMGFEKLNKYISIRKKIYTTVIAGTGLGKSAFVHSAYILNPYDWSVINCPGKIKVILFSMERSATYTLAKWLSRRIFLEEGILIPMAKILGWWEEKLTFDEHDLVKKHQPYFQEMLDSKAVEIIEGNQNPTGVYKYIKSYAQENGRFEQEDEYHKIYIPNDGNKIVMPIIDHASLVRMENGMRDKKAAIDKLSEYMQWSRDFLSYSPIVVMQQNRDIGNATLLKSGEAEPSLEMAKDSGTPIEDCDVSLSLYNPMRYKQNDPSGYKLENFVNPSNGAFYYRNLKILKSTYSESDLRLGVGFQGVTGIFSELPSSKNMDGFNYESLFDGQFFTKKKKKTKLFD